MRPSEGITEQEAGHIYDTIEHLQGIVSKPGTLNIIYDNDINRSPLEKAESQIIKRTLAYFGGNKTKTKDALGITVNTLNAKIKKYDINMEAYR